MHYIWRKNKLCAIVTTLANIPQMHQNLSAQIVWKKALLDIHSPYWQRNIIQFLFYLCMYDQRMMQKRHFIRKVHTCIKPYYYTTSFLSHTHIHFMRTPEPLVHTQAQLSKLFLRPNVCHHKLRPLPARYGESCISLSQHTM